MRWACFALLFLLPSCGVIWPYAYDARDVEEQLAIAMSQDQVSKTLGKPAQVMQHDDQTIVWEYWRYPKGLWVGYLLHCPFHPYCYLPAEPRNPYYVAFRKDHVCLWGTPDLVRTLIEQVCIADSTSQTVRSDGRARRSSISVVPVFMPVPIAVPLQRLAILRIGGEANPQVAAWLDLTINFLHSRHPQVMYVEREALHAVSEEVAIQYSGRVDDSTMVHIGKLTGADSLLTYRAAMSAPGEPLTASLELRVLTIESGMTLFRQMTTATVSPTVLQVQGTQQLQQSTRYLALEEAAAYGFAALTAAFGDNGLGIVPDRGGSQKGITLLGLLEGSPAARAGLQEDDCILEVDHRPVANWTEPIRVPAHLTVDRHGQRVEITVDD